MEFLKEYEAWYSYYSDATAGQEVCRCVALLMTLPLHKIMIVCGEKQDLGFRAHPNPKTEKHESYYYIGLHLTSRAGIQCDDG